MAYKERSGNFNIFSHFNALISFIGIFLIALYFILHIFYSIKLQFLFERYYLLYLPLPHGMRRKIISVVSPSRIVMFGLYSCQAFVDTDLQNGRNRKNAATSKLKIGERWCKIVIYSTFYCKFISFYMFLYRENPAADL